MNQRYAEAPTVKQAINKALDRQVEGKIIPIKAKFAQDFLEQTFIDHLLVHNGRLGTFNFVDAVSRGRTLFVGEGNLSFSLALAKLSPNTAQRFVATTFEPAQRLSPTARQNANHLSTAGTKILYGIDATQLQTHFGATKFHAIIFNFPNVASRAPIYGRNPNHILTRKFLRSAAQQLKRDGIVSMTVVDSPFYDGAFNLPKAARFAGFREPEVYGFQRSRFPGYRHVNTLDDQSALAKHRGFSTWVFRLP